MAENTENNPVENTEEAELNQILDNELENIPSPPENTVNENTGISSGNESGEKIPKEEKRGRHKKDCTCAKCTEKRTVKTETKPKEKTTSGRDKLADVLNEYETVKPEEIKQPGTANEVKPQAAFVINGMLLLIMCDAVFPFLIKYLFGLFNPEIKKVDLKKIKLTDYLKNQTVP